MRPAPFVGNIVVSNLPENFTGGDLAALFDDYGLVLGAVISRGKSDAGKAMRGLVNLAPAKAVEAAIKSLDGTVVDAHHLRVRKAPEPPPRPKKAPRPAGARPSFRNGFSQGYRDAAPAYAASRPTDDAYWPPSATPAAARPARTVVVERRPLGRRFERPAMTKLGGSEG